MGVTIKEWQVEVTSHTLEWSKSTIKSKTFHIQEVHKRLNCHQLLTLLSIALRKSRLRVNLSLHSMRFFIINSDNCFPCNSRLHWGILCLDKNGCEHGEVGWFYLTRSWNRCLSGPVISKKSIWLKDNGCDATLMPYLVTNNSFNLSKIIRCLSWLEFTDITEFGCRQQNEKKKKKNRGKKLKEIWELPKRKACVKDVQDMAD